MQRDVSIADTHKDLAYEIVEGLTSEVGPRLAATATDGITGDVIGFASIDALRAAPESAVRGKIVYVSHSMSPTRDGSSYEYLGPVRVRAPSFAAKKGAMGIVVRSLGTDSHRAPHTGGTHWDGVTPIRGAEEMQPFGARAYFRAHKHEPHALGAEADFGADRVWLLRTNFPPTAKPVGDRLVAALVPLGIGADGPNTIEGEDFAQFIESGVSGVYLAQDLGRYFDFHHTPEDTLDKIDPAQLRQCVQAWTQMLEIVANAPEDLAASRSVDQFACR